MYKEGAKNAEDAFRFDRVELESEGVVTSCDRIVRSDGPKRPPKTAKWDYKVKAMYQQYSPVIRLSSD